MLDLIIRGADVVDGTGAPRRRADVGVRDGRVVAIGEITEDASTVIDADGQVVAPGFVDIHTHYDAQVLWDPAVTPSPLHGVTTVVGGNCGFTIAPVEASETDYLTRMLARVEGMPLESLLEGVPYDWRTFGDYLDKIDGKTAVNAGFLVGHSAIRRCVMGDDAVGKPASEDQIEAMQALLAESLDCRRPRLLVVVGADAQRRRRRSRPVAGGHEGRAARVLRDDQPARGHDAGVHPVGRRLRGGAPPADGGHVPHREPAAQLERAGPELRASGVRVGSAECR